jgi:hypothetical protein
MTSSRPYDIITYVQIRRKRRQLVRSELLWAIVVRLLISHDPTVLFRFRKFKIQYLQCRPVAINMIRAQTVLLLLLFAVSLHS